MWQHTSACRTCARGRPSPSCRARRKSSGSSTEPGHTQRIPFAVVYDACVLYPAAVRDLLIRVARTGLVQARWSDRILDECFASIRRDRPELSGEHLARTRALMHAALPAANVTHFEDLIGGLVLPDPDDRHVVAAAIRSGAQAIVTYNLKDFPADALARYDLEAKYPDDFVLDCLDLAPALVAGCVREQAGDLRAPPRSVEDVLTFLRARGLVQSVARLHDLFGAPPSTGSFTLG